MSFVTIKKYLPIPNKDNIEYETFYKFLSFYNIQQTQPNYYNESQELINDPREILDNIINKQKKIINMFTFNKIYNGICNRCKKENEINNEINLIKLKKVQFLPIYKIIQIPHEVYKDNQLYQLSYDLIYYCEEFDIIIDRNIINDQDPISELSLTIPNSDKIYDTIQLEKKIIYIIHGNNKIITNIMILPISAKPPDNYILFPFNSKTVLLYNIRYPYIIHKYTKMMIIIIVYMKRDLKVF